MVWKQALHVPTIPSFTSSLIVTLPVAVQIEDASLIPYTGAYKDGLCLAKSLYIYMVMCLTCPFTFLVCFAYIWR